MTADCGNVVYEFATSMNEWSQLFAIASRIADGKFVRASNRERLKEHNVDSLLERHRLIFDQFIVPRNRIYGSNPGEPNSWGDGPFFDVARSTVGSVNVVKPRRATVVAAWGYPGPGGETMFVLHQIAGTWKIDSLKTRFSTSDKWQVAYI